MKRILTNKIFMALFTADKLSNFGDVLYYLALMNYVLLIPQAKLAIALVTLSETLPYLAMIFMGIWGDKTANKVDTIIATQFFRLMLYLLVGSAMSFSPSLWIVLVAICANMLSDLAGQYENALYIPLSLRIVEDQDREAMYAFRQATGSVLQIVFQSSGAVFSRFMTYQQLAFFNAGTFAGPMLVMFVLRNALNKRLQDRPVDVEQLEHSAVSRNFVRNSWHTLKDSYAEVQNLPLLKSSIVTMAGLNAVFIAVGTLLILNIKDYPHFVLVSPATTLAVFTIFRLLGNIVGSLLATTLLKNLSFKPLLQLSVVMPVLMFGAFLLHNIFLVLLVIFLTTVLVGIFQPKMHAYVVRSLPENRLATIGAGIDSFCTVGMVGMQVVLSFLVVVLSANQISFLFLLLSLLLLIFTLRNSQKQESESMGQAC